MTSNAIKRFFIRFAFFTAGMLATTSASAAEDGQLFFTALAGDNSAGTVPVLLRWYSSEGEIPFTEFSLYRKEGDSSSTGTLELISVTSQLRNVPLIRSIFELPENKQAYIDLLDVLDHMLDVPVTADTYVEQLINLLDSTEGCASCVMRRNMLMNSNYAVAIVEGLGYVDHVSPKTYTYELRASTGSGSDDVVLGRVTIDASTPTLLSEPTKPEEVEISGERGHLKIYLKWDMTADLEDHRNAMFGYNVYRAVGDKSSSTFESLYAAGQLKKINRLPILPPSAQAVGTTEEESYIFMDDNKKFGEAGPEGTPFTPNNKFTYWVTARDLQGRNGKPSDPIVAVAEDKAAPAVPRGLATEVIDDPVPENILLSWNRNNDDTSVYKVYRYREYDHAGRTEAFASIDGLTEGFMASVPQQATDTIRFRDPQIKLPTGENKAYWYCVSAVDNSGNESRLSPPIRGVIFDTTPPDPPKQPRICLNFFDCRMSNVFIADRQISPTQKTESDILFVLKRLSDKIHSAKIEQLGPNNRISLIYQGVFTREILSATDNYRPYDEDEGARYIITFTTVDGRICGPSPLPDEIIRTIQSAGGKYVVQIEATVEYRERCISGETGPQTHEPLDPSGNIDPLTFTFEQTEDSVGVVLYRSPDCEHYYPVTEGYYNGAATITLNDPIHPEQGGRLCYAAATFDENHNTSSLTYITSQVLLSSEESAQVLPSMISAEPRGDSSVPEVSLKWFGPSNAVAGYRIYFGTDEELNGLETTVELNSSEYTFDSATSSYLAKLGVVDDSTGANLQMDRTYILRVEALMQNGETRVSNNTLTFNWATQPETNEHPAWPVRGLPPDGGALTAAWVITPGVTGKFTYGVGIQVATVSYTREQTMSFSYLFTTPFIVYRKRVDVSDGTYVQVSPLITTINITSSGPQDPFFIIAYPSIAQGNDNTIKLYYLDTVDLVQGALYEYKIVQLDSTTGEIKTMYGPSNTVEVVGP